MAVDRAGNKQFMVWEYAYPEAQAIHAHDENIIHAAILQVQNITSRQPRCRQSQNLLIKARQSTLMLSDQQRLESPVTISRIVNRQHS